MAPIPVIGLLFLAGPREFVILPVSVGQVDSPGVVLTIIPVVVVLVVGIVYSDLDVSVFGSGSGQNCDRCRQDCGEQKRIDATMCKAHMNILQEKLHDFSVGTARSEGELVNPAFGDISCLSGLPACKSIMRGWNPGVCALLHVFQILQYFARQGVKPGVAP
jgi:hypothetical protein